MVSPETVVTESFLRIERQLYVLLSEAGIDPQGRGAPFLARLAEERGLIPSEIRQAVDGLAVLRNLAAHGRAPADLDPDRALEYANLAEAVLYGLASSRRRAASRPAAGTPEPTRVP